MTEKQWFIECCANAPLVARLKKITFVVTDIDGCLTDANVYFGEREEEMKAMSVQDGYGIKYGIKQGLLISFLSGRKSTAVMLRGSDLDIPPQLCHVGASDKSVVIQQMQQEFKADVEETLYVGDDVIDLPVRPFVGIFVAPANGLFYIKDQADLILPRAGGESAFRVLVDLVLFVQGRHFAQQVIEQSLARGK